MLCDPTDCSTPSFPVLHYYLHYLSLLKFISIESVMLSNLIYKVRVTKVHLVKAMVFPVVVYGCESRTIKKAEHQRIDAFEPWCWRRLLRVP